MSNLSPDWGNHYQTCTLCHGTYHASGVVECDCLPCVECGELVAPWSHVEQDELCARHYEGKLEAQDREPITS